MTILGLFAMFVFGVFVGALIMALMAGVKRDNLEHTINALQEANSRLQRTIDGMTDILKDKTTEFEANVGLLRGEALLFKQDVNKLLYPHGWVIIDEDGFRKLKKSIKAREVK